MYSIGSKAKIPPNSTFYFSLPLFILADPDDLSHARGGGGGDGAITPNRPTERTEVSKNLKCMHIETGGEEGKGGFGFAIRYTVCSLHGQNMRKSSPFRNGETALPMQGDLFHEACKERKGESHVCV